MKRYPHWLFCLFFWLGLVSCQTGIQTETAVPVPSPLPAVISTATVINEQSQVTSAVLPSTTTRLPSTNTPAPTTLFLPSPTLIPTLSATPDPYLPYTIDALRARRYGGGLLNIIETIEKNERFTRYLITYPSNGLTIYGYLSVPNEGDYFPVAIVLHGYINPADYETVPYTRRYADSLVEAGYFVIHPNLRGYPPSDSGDNAFRTGMAIDVLNLIAIIREQSQDPTGYLRRADRDNIHLWGHSMGGGIALRVLTVNNANYLKTAVLYGAMSGNEIWNYERISQWRGSNDLFELDASPERLAEISPITYLSRLKAAISIHHSHADTVVPVAWSEDLCQRLQAIEHPVECFFYERVPHTFNGGADALFMERAITFFQRY